MDDVFLTTEEVLEYLQVNLRTVYRLIKAGKIPAVRVGRQWRFRKADIDLWLGRATAPGPLRRPRRPMPVPGRGPRRDAAQRGGRGCWWWTTRPASATCWRRRWRWPSTTSTRRRTAGPRSTRLRAQSYDLLITDLKMPGMDGLTLIREARRLSPQLPVVIITAYSTEASAIESVNLGVNGYLTKPFRITKILEHRRQHSRRIGPSAALPAVRPRLHGLRPSRSRRCADEHSTDVSWTAQRCASKNL